MRTIGRLGMNLIKRIESKISNFFFEKIIHPNLIKRIERGRV